MSAITSRSLTSSSTQAGWNVVVRSAGPDDPLIVRFACTAATFVINAAPRAVMIIPADAGPTAAVLWEGTGKGGCCVSCDRMCDGIWSVTPRRVQRSSWARRAAHCLRRERAFAGTSDCGHDRCSQ